MAVKMRTGRLTTKTTDPKTGARISDPSVYGMEVDGGKVSSWPEVRTMYQQGKLKKEFAGRTNLNPEVKSYLEGKTDKLSDTEYEEPILTKMQDAGGSFTGLNMNLKKGGKKYQEMESSFKGAGFEKPSAGMKVHYDVSERPLSGSNKMQGRGTTTDLDVIREKKKSDNVVKENPKPGPQPTKEQPMAKMTTLKPTRVSERPAKVKPLAEKEEYSFAPATRGTKTKTKTSAAMTGAGSDLTRAKNPSGKLGAARVTETEKKGKLGYKREQALFEAKAGTSVSGRDFSNMSAAEIKNKKQEIKQDRRDYRKSSYEGKNVGIKEATMDIRQARKAQTYTRKAEAGNLSHFTPGYKKGEDKQGPNRIEAFKGSMENATNRNTMKSKLDAISKKPTNRTNMY
jgi:hypothetical protein